MDNSKDLRQLALEISIAHDQLSISCAAFGEEVKRRLDAETCEECKGTLNDLLGAIIIVQPMLYALCRLLQFFKFDQAAMAAHLGNIADQSTAKQSEQSEQSELN